MMSRVAVTMLAGVSGTADHTNLMQATKNIAVQMNLDEKVAVDSVGEVFDAESEDFSRTSKCEKCVGRCVLRMERLGKPTDQCRPKCEKGKKCPKACVQPTERPASLEEEDQTSRGPAAGSLVICGGACNAKSGAFDKVLELAGGRENAKLIYIPTNWHDDRDYLYENQTVVDETFSAFKELSGWGDLPNPLKWVHTRDRDVADSDEFVAQFADATGVWMKGGRQWRGMDAYGGTRTEEAIKDVLARGGVFGGTSAGASIQGDFLVRGDTVTNQLIVGDHQRGFGFVHNVAIDQHNTQRRRNGGLLDWIDEHPEYLGISIDENTAAVVQGDELEVIGENVVEIVDATAWQETNYCSNYSMAEGLGRPLLPHHEKYFFLKAKSLGGDYGERFPEGDRYNIRTREVLCCAKR